MKYFGFFFLAVFLCFFIPSKSLGQVDLVAQPNKGETTKSSSPYQLTEYRGKYLFGATDFKGQGLFVTDGTEDGTYCITHEAIPQWNSRQKTMQPFNGKIFFLGYDRFNGYYLWETDGTNEGTKKVIDFSEIGDYPSRLEICGDSLVVVFAGNLRFLNRNMKMSEKFWSEDRETYSASFLGSYMIFHNAYGVYEANLETGETKEVVLEEERVYSIQVDVHKNRALVLVKTDTGVQKLFLLNLSSFEATEVEGWQNPDYPLSNYLKTAKSSSGFYFITYGRDGNFNNEISLYRIEADSITKSYSFNDVDYSSNLLTVNDTLIWALGGIEPDIGFYKVTDHGLDPLSIGFVPKNYEVTELIQVGQDWLIAERELYYFKSSTHEIITLLDNYGYYGIVKTPSCLFLTHYENDSAAYDEELYVFRDIDEGVVRVKDINTDKAFAEISELTSVDNQLFFAANTQEYGHELWVTDGNITSTKLVKDIDTVTHAHPADLIEYNGNLYFTVMGWHQSYKMEQLEFTGLWRSDGTEKGTYKIEDFAIPKEKTSPEIFKTVFNNELYFFGYPKNAKGDGQLWRTDGQVLGAKLVDPFNARGVGMSTMYLRSVQNQLFCTGQGGVYSLSDQEQQLRSLNLQTGNDWRLIDSNGSQAKTIASESKMYFVASNFGLSTHPKQIWVTDGTIDGTKMITDQPSLVGYISGWPTIDVQFHIATDTCLFFSMHTESDGKELWYSDGTYNGTIRLTGFNENFPMKPKTFGSAALLNGKCYLAISDENNGSELWVSDGTRAGTKLFIDIVEGANSSEPTNLLLYQDHLFFFTEGDNISAPLWITDGTVKGTKPLPWDYERLVNFKEAHIWKDDLYFVATHPDDGQGIYKYNLGGLTGVVQEFDSPILNYSIYPNPVSDLLYVEIKNMGHNLTEAVLMNSLGRKIKSYHKLEGDFQISVKGLLPGIYFIRIGDIVHKFIKL